MFRLLCGRGNNQKVIENYDININKNKKKKKDVIESKKECIDSKEEEGKEEEEGGDTITSFKENPSMNHHKGNSSTHIKGGKGVNIKVNRKAPLPGGGQIGRSSSFFGNVGSLEKDTPTSSPRSSQRKQNLKKGVVTASLSRILVLYCGGTIGMKRDPVKGYLPVKNYLSNFLGSHDRFHDIDDLHKMLNQKKTHSDIHSLDESLGDILLLPDFSAAKKRVAYQIHEVSVVDKSYGLSTYLIL